MNDYISGHIKFLRAIMERVPVEKRGTPEAKKLALEVRRLEESRREVLYPHDVHK